MTIYLCRFIGALLSLLTIAPSLVTAEQNHTPKFTDYPVNHLYVGPHANVALATSEERAYRTRLREASKQDVNFAGEYVLTTWGCGSTCLTGAVVSLRTGYVVFLPGTVCCWEGKGERLSFQSNSRLIIARGIIDEESEHGLHFYEFTRGSFKHIRTVPVQKDFSMASENNQSISGEQDSMSDILMAVMDDGYGEKTMHQQIVPRSQCDYALREFKSYKNSGRQMQLTFSDPPYSGYVSDLFCIDASGEVKQ